MASQLKVDTLTGVTTAGSIAVTGEGNSTTTNLQQGLAKHWARIDQTSSNAVADSFNNASVTDGGTGITTFNNTTNMGNGNHAPAMSTEVQSSYTSIGNSILSSGVTTTGMKGYHTENASAQDTQTFIMQTFGDLA